MRAFLVAAALFALCACQSSIELNHQYTYEGIGFYAKAAISGRGYKPVYRAWSSLKTEHVFTDSLAEYNSLVNNSQLQGIAFYVLVSQAAGTVPLYRLYSSTYTSNNYTVLESERSALIASGFVDKGIVGYVFAVETAGWHKVYRMYQQRADVFITMSEYDVEQATPFKLKADIEAAIRTAFKMPAFVLTAKEAQYVIPSDSAAPLTAARCLAALSGFAQLASAQDSDDFAFLMKAEFEREMFEDGTVAVTHTTPLAVGVAWGTNAAGQPVVMNIAVVTVMGDAQQVAVKLIDAVTGVMYAVGGTMNSPMTQVQVVVM